MYLFDIMRHLASLTIHARFVETPSVSHTFLQTYHDSSGDRRREVYKVGNERYHAWNRAENMYHVSTPTVRRSFIAVIQSGSKFRTIARVLIQLWEPCNHPMNYSLSAAAALEHKLTQNSPPSIKSLLLSPA